MSSDGLLDAATAIARRIVADAVWYEGRCNWIGAALEPREAAHPEYRALGPTLHDGTAGVGLFLAQLATVIDDASLRRTASGALRHAVERAGGEGDGLQAGTHGIAWAAARTGGLLGSEEPAAGARAVLERTRGDRRRLDVFQGGAGTAVALLGLARELGEADLVARASGIGEELLECATVTRRGWSWADPDRPGAHHLCGVAHGASGIGWALLELFAATGQVRFAASASGAFAYERAWLDEESGTWPDLRLPASARLARTRMTATWCHGEAGIALSRLRAVAMLGDGPHRRDADIAVNTTRRHLAARLPYAIDDLSLCHGAGGAAIALVAAGERDAAIALGDVALDRFGARGDWPCGAYGITPALYRGLSGIGWLLLCLHNPQVPSPLALPAAG